MTLTTSMPREPELGRERAEDRIVRGLPGQLDRGPADLRRLRAACRSAGGRGEQPRPEAHAEQRNSAVQELERRMTNRTADKG